MNSDLFSFIKIIPKAELHLHIEGTFEPELMFSMAQKNNIALQYKTVDELKSAYTFSCLQDFLDIYYLGTNVLIEEEDFYALTWAYLTKCNEQNIVHTEIMFDPQSHTHRGIEFATIIHGITRACNDANTKFGITTILIMSFLRHLSEEDAFVTLEQSLPYKHLIKAIGLDSSELGNPPTKFKNVFKKAIDAGYIPLAHAGEEGSVDYIYEALDELKIIRIDHGNKCLDDKDLVQKIINNDIALTLCPLSNLELKVVNDITLHPIKKMLEMGLKVTVNSDDPAYFGGYLNENFEAITRALDLKYKDIYTLVFNSFKYSLLDEDKKDNYLKQLDKFYVD